MIVFPAPGSSASRNRSGCRGKHGFINRCDLVGQRKQSAESKAFTDFNDLAKSSILGMNGVKRQVQSVIDKTVKELEQRIKPKRELEMVNEKTKGKLAKKFFHKTPSKHCV
jgi:hypothetical protein